MIVKELEEKGFEKKEIDEQINLLDSAILSIQNSIEEAEQEYCQQSEDYKDRVRAMYKNSKSTYIIEEILMCQDFNELFKKIKIMALIADADKKLMEKMINSLDENKTQKKKKEKEIQTCMQLSI